MSNLNNKNFMLNEMITHIPLNTHISPKNILVVGEVDDEFKAEISKYSLDVEYGDISIITSKDEKSIDVIIFADDTNIDELLLANINKILNDDGVITFRSEMFEKNSQKVIDDLKLVGDCFWIAMPFRFGHNLCILASKKYHPQADIILQRSDLLDDLNYYTSEIHNSSFVLPKYINDALLGIAKR
jgi:spermidine synthase